MCGYQYILLALTGTTNSKNIVIFIWPDILARGLFAIINRYQKKFAEQTEYTVPWSPLKYSQAYKVVNDCMILMWYLTDNLMSITSSAVVVCVFYIASWNTVWSTSALYATCIEIFIETALSNATQTVTGSSFDIVSWTVYPRPLHYQHYTELNYRHWLVMTRSLLRVV